MSSSRSKRTSTSSPSRSVSSSTSSSTSSSGTTSKGGAGTARSSPSRSTTRASTSSTSTGGSTPSPSISTAKKPSSVFVNTIKDTTDSSFGDIVSIPSIPEVSAQTPTISSEVQSILNELEGKEPTFPNWFNNNIRWVKDGTITNDEFLNGYNNLVQQGIITTPIIKEIMLVPKAGNISFDNITENSVMVSWSSNSSPVTGFHLVIMDEDAGQTKHILDPISGMTNTIFSNLDAATNYRVYLIVINDVGNSPEINKGFKTLGIKKIQIIISSEVQTILTKFDNNDYTYPEWFVNNIKWVKDGTITSSEFLNAFNNLLQTGIVIDKTALPVDNTTISLDMISQSIGAFKLENGKVTGDIIYIAEKSFNPYYYNKSLTSIVQIKDQVGRVIKLKSNNLNFTEIERDERISINEGIGDVNAVKIEFLVWKSLEDPSAFSKMKMDEIVADEVGLQPCQIGYHRDWNNNCVRDNELPPDKLMDTLKGFLFGTVALSLLARK